MATAAKPTNEHIAKMLDQVLRDLEQVKKTQEQLVSDLRKVAQHSNT